MNGRRTEGSWWLSCLAGLGLLITVSSSQAQYSGSTGGGTGGSTGGSMGSTGSSGARSTTGGSTSGGSSSGTSASGASVGLGFGQGNNFAPEIVTGSNQSGAARVGNTTTIGQGTPFGRYYAHPLAAGLPDQNSRATFGTGLYPNLHTNTSTTSGLLGTGRNTATSGGLRGGVTGLTSSNTFGRSGSSGLGMNRSGTSNGVRTAPAYVTSLAFNPRPMPVSTLQRNLIQSIQRSTSLTPNHSIEVALENSTAVLRGGVANEDERRHAEALMRLTPGVRDVRNELQVRGVSVVPKDAP